MTIEDFCDELLRDDCPASRLAPEGLAEDFIRRFQVPLRVSLDDLAVLLECAGIARVSGKRMRRGLRGVHYLEPDGTYAIEYEERQWEGGKVHTVLHETSEIIQETVWHRRFGALPPGPLCPEADRFAAAVMMPPDSFASYASATGLDLVALQRLFRSSYLSVARRLGEVMREQPLLAVLYERRGWNTASWREPAPPREFRATAVVRTPGFGERYSHLLGGSRGRVPLPERCPAPGSLAERVIRTGGPEYAEMEFIEGRHGKHGVAVSVRPVFWNGKLAKVALLAVPYEHRMALAPQLDGSAFRGRDLSAPLNTGTVLT